MAPDTDRNSSSERRVSGLGLVILGLFAILFAGLLAFDLTDIRRKPTVLLDVYSEGVTFRTDTIVDLVQRAGLGLRPGELKSAGVGFDSVWVDSADFRIDTETVPAPPSFPSGGNGVANRDSARRDVSQFLQGLAVNGGCDVHLERHAHGVTRVGFAALPQRDSSSSPTCRVRGRLYVLPDSSGPEPAIIVDLDTTLVGRSTASLYVQRPEPFSLRDLPVSGLRFEQPHSEQTVESSILGGWIRMPEPRDREERLYFRDRLRLGRLSESALRVVVDDSIRSFFRGKSSDPWLGRGEGEGESLVPSLLQAAYHDEHLRIWASMAGGILAALVGVMRLLRP